MCFELEQQQTTTLIEQETAWSHNSSRQTVVRTSTNQTTWTKTVKISLDILAISIASYLRTCGETVATELVAAMAEPEKG